MDWLETDTYGNSEGHFYCFNNKSSIIYLQDLQGLE